MVIFLSPSCLPQLNSISVLVLQNVASTFWSFCIAGNSCTRALPVAMEIEWKGHIRRPTRCNHVVYHEALLSSNVRPVTPPLAGARRARERAVAKRDEAYRGAPSAAGPRRRSARSRRAELSRGVLGRPGREAARDRSRSPCRIICQLHGDNVLRRVFVSWIDKPMISRSILQLLRKWSPPSPKWPKYVWDSSCHRS